MTMFPLRSILCPVDFSDQSQEALRWAVALAAEHRSRLTVFSAVDPLLAEAAKARLHMDLAQTETEALREFVRTTLPGSCAGVAEMSFDAAVGHAPERILEAAARQVDLVVMGTHGLSGFRKLLLGSTTDRVLRRTRTAVLAVPGAPHHGVVPGEGSPRLELNRILVGTDFSEASAAATRRAADLAQRYDVPLVLTHVIAPLVVSSRWQSYVTDMDEERTRSARARLEALSASCKGIRCDTVVALGRPADALAATAEERQAGLIVVGLMGEDAGREPQPGSTAYRVLCLSHVPVLVVPPSSTSESAQAR